MPTVVLLKSESVDGPDKYIDLLSSHNFEVISIATLIFSFKNLDQLKIKLQNPNNYSGIIFTSPRAVISIKKALEDIQLLDEWKNLHNYTVGDQSHGLSKTLINLETKGQKSGNASNLAAFIWDDQQQKTNLKPFLFPCGNLKQDTLESKLINFEIAVDTVEVYETHEHPDLTLHFQILLKQKVDILIYFSPSGVKFTIDIIRKNLSQLNDLKYVAIGPSTKKALEDHNLTVFRTCNKPSPESLLKVLLE